jgi:hypothetical protein
MTTILPNGTDYPESLDYSFDLDDIWQNYWGNLKDILRQKLIEKLETPEERRLRILQEEAARLEVAKKAAWYQLVPAGVAIAVAASIGLFLARRK